MSIPVIFTQSTYGIPVTTAAQLASTQGSIITLLDIALINGHNQVDIVSISRIADIAIVETTSEHNVIIGETVHIENTGEANFNGKFKPFQILTPTTYSIIVEDIGATNTGAIGTSKLAAAGWTKIGSGTNWACYQSANYPDGLPRFIQIEDNAPYSNSYDFRVRLAKGWTALNVAEKISAQRKFTKINSNFRWAIVADDLTIQMFFAGTTNYYLGKLEGLGPEDDNISCLSTGTDGGVYGAQFGAQSIVPAAQLLNTTTITILESPMSPITDTMASVSVCGSPTVAVTILGTLQNYLRPINPISGKYNISPISIWEKSNDAGQTHYFRARARGIFQPMGKLPINIPGDTVAYWLPIREVIDSTHVIDSALFNTTNITATSSSQVLINLKDW